ncbi:MAG TPA: aminotransferase class I/II-fold pyridoxal phosphate-dependent enzyme [Syntrophorhabdales bacterium]|nr:aminotransferase class I/II-fold pyridoxal phosphate-dependent enzyme [Syntrophorhabdales bacterium]
MQAKLSEGHMWLGQRVQTVRPSGVRKIFDMVRKVKDPVNMSLGEPDFDVPAPIKEEAVTWTRRGFNKYTPSGGIPELREKLSAQLKARSVFCEDVIITPGVTGGILLAMMVTLNPGDEVIIPDPSFVMYEYQTILLGGSPVFVDTYPDFTLKEELLQQAITPKTKIIIVNSPANPTGAVCSREELEMVARVAREKNILLFSDDIYERFFYETGSAPPCLGQLCDNVLTFGGFSKTWGMTGWRVGYVAGPRDIIDAMVTMLQYVFSGVHSVAQKAAVFALDYPTDEIIETYRRKRDLIYDGIKDKFRIVKPKGAYYIFPEVPDGDGDAFVERALANNLFIIPGSVFSRKKSNVRISFAADEATVLRGIEILRKLV